MFEIVKREDLNSEVQNFTIKAPAVARAYKPGQFVILRVDKEGERVPLTVVRRDTKNGTIDIISQIVGASTFKLSRLKAGDSLTDLVGPLGKPTHIEKFGNVIVIGGGAGIAPLLPITQALRGAGNKITSILGARNLKLLILQDEMSALSDKVLITTDDGSAGKKGLVTHSLSGLLDDGEKIDFVLAIGPLIMMKAVCEITKKHNVKTMVSLNPIMLDGTGMCGVCRCTINGETRFACIHGPEFNGHEVDFDELMRRQFMYREKEKLAYDRIRGK